MKQSRGNQTKPWFPLFCFLNVFKIASDLWNGERHRGSGTFHLPVYFSSAGWYNRAMAYNRAPREHAFLRIEKDLKAGTVPPVVLLCGSEGYLTDHYREKLIETYVNPAARAMDLTAVEREEASPEFIGQTGQTLSLLSERKVIWIRDFINERGKYPKIYEDESVKIKDFFACLKEIPRGTVLIITCSQPNTTGDYRKKSDGRKLKKLGEAVKKAGGAWYEFDALNTGQLNSFVVSRMKRAGKDCTRQVLRRIVYDTGYDNSSVNYDLYALENDLKKIIAHAGERRTITEEDLEGTLTINPENNIFHMLDALARNRKDQALVLLNTLLADGESEFGIISSIVKQLEYLYIARELQDEGKNGAQAASWLTKEEKVSPYRAKNVASAAFRMNRGKLRHMFRAALAMEEHIKGGLMDGRLSLEYFISEA